MGRKKSNKSKPLFPENIEWWNSPGKDTSTGRSDTNNNGSNDNQGDNDDNVNNKYDYGSILPHSAYNFQPLVDDDNGNNNNAAAIDDNDDVEEGEPSFLIDKVIPVDFTDNNAIQHYDEFGQLDVQSDISNSNRDSNANSSSVINSSSNSSDDDDGSSDDDNSSSSEYEDEIEQPHRTLGLIFFDFLRFVALSADVRCVNTQMVPVFLAWGKMDLLDVALR